MENYYTILKIQQNASFEEIKKAYRKLALEFHPDRNKNQDAHNIFIKINEAYQVLSNEQLRLEYDKILYGKSDNKDFEEKVYNEEFRRKAESYSSMKVEDFEMIIEEITNVGKTVKKGVEMGCGFIMMIVCGLFTILCIFNLSESPLGVGLQIVLILFFAFFTFAGWGLSRKDS